jgi:hypothetical protein
LTTDCCSVPFNVNPFNPKHDPELYQAYEIGFGIFGSQFELRQLIIKKWVELLKECDVPFLYWPAGYSEEETI